MNDSATALLLCIYKLLKGGADKNMEKNNSKDILNVISLKLGQLSKSLEHSRGPQPLEALLSDSPVHAHSMLQCAMG